MKHQNVRVPSKGLIGFVANCSDCKYETSDYIDGPRLVKEHFKQTGHKIGWEATVHGQFIKADKAAPYP